MVVKSQSPRESETVQLLNVQIDNISLLELLRDLERGVVLTPNVDHLVQLQKDSAFLNLYAQADYRVCDSQILLYASYFLGTPLKQRISGSDLFPAFCDFHKSNPSIRIFLLGGATGVPEQATSRINSRIGRTIVVGAYSPPFGFETDELECLSIIERIKQSGATVLAIGVGAPKQEKWIYKYKDKLSTIKIFLAIGATINFEAGIIKRAPQWVSRSGVEWLYRLLSEPRRLWRRYLINDISFFWLVLKQKLGLYKLSCWSVSQGDQFDEKIRVVMLGPSLRQQGGMASVEKLIATQISKAVEIQHISTHEEGTVFHRLQIFTWAFVQLLRSLLWMEVDLVHLHISERGSVLRNGICAVLAGWFRKPVVIHTHGCEFHIFYDRLPQWAKRSVASIFQRSAYVIALSESWKTYYTSACNLKPSQAIVLYNPIVVPATIPERTGGQKIRFVFLGRIGQRKGAFDVIHAIARLPESQRERIELLLAGDGEVNQARELVDSLGLQDCVKLLGWIDAETRNQLLSDSDVFVLPSYNEGLPIALLEAMAWGLPAITTPVGGIPEVVDQKNGFLVEPGNVEQIAAAMQTLIENESLRLAMGSNGRHRVAPLNIDDYFITLLSIYRQAIMGCDSLIDTVLSSTSNLCE